MLNISNSNPIAENIDQFKTIKDLSIRPHYKILNRIIAIVSILAIIILFLPWTQNISGSGAVTTLKPDQRPQSVHTAIAGRIEKWYVNEGDYVEKGDTILFISEIKEDYFDPNLVENTTRQAEAKKSSGASYDDKINAIKLQISAIENEKNLKIQQAQNKIKQAKLKIMSDSMDLQATKTQLKIAQTQYNRSVQLNSEGLKPITDLEEKRLKLQENEAKIITQENKFLNSKNEFINAKVEIGRIDAEYADKASKARGEQSSAMSAKYETQAQVNKLENQVVNYTMRNELYYIKAPQSGFVNKALQSGLGETIKEGTPVVSIMPSKYDVAVETYIEPNDLPLIAKGEKIRIWFDGWPTIVFSGWPDLSYGTFGGQIVAIEKFISPNGKYRVLISEDSAEGKWPKQLSIGSGAKTIALLDNVPIWFELWRKLNGFPPNYYKNNDSDDKKTKK
jgi:multidrug resistance efflux pump